MNRHCVAIATFGLIFVCGLHAGIRIAVAASPKPLTCKSLVAAQRASLSPGKVVEKTESELSAIYAERTCVKSYPWPPKLMVEADKLAKVTSEEMRLIKNQVEALVIEYQKVGKAGARLHGEKDFVAYRFYSEGVERRDMKLLQKFGYILYSQVLIREGLLDEAKAILDEAFAKWAISVRDAPWDEGDKTTYFSDSTLDKVLLLNKYRVLAESPATSREEALKVADEYFRARPLLANEIDMFGDPGADLLDNAGCQ